ncbi:hypothetical protein HCN44_009504 [Aphidius gifuensis]|uniref:Cadherin domain-containing protein n=1 Tax=Aphidius gifuensis TaxID=684658 RepID=A0A834Y4U0_APHGI|nr:hypothetical protein HCN44_009504 [Aphidius gifuensis]
MEIHVKSEYVVFVSEHGEIDTPVTKYFWVKNNSGPVDYKIFETDTENYFSVAKIYDSDMDIYYGQIVVNKNFNYRGKKNYTDLEIKASDKFSNNILPVRIYYINTTEPAIKLNPLDNSYSELKQIAKDSVKCIATVHASGISITDNPIQYNISEASSERYLGSSTYSEEVVKSLFVKIDKDTGCIQIQKYNGLHQNELMVVRAYYKHDDSPKPLVSEHLMKMRPVNLNNQMYNVTVTDAM